MRLLPILPRPLYKSDPFSFVSSQLGFCRPGISDVALAECLIWGFVFGVSGFILSGAFALSRDHRVIFHMRLHFIHSPVGGRLLFAYKVVQEISA